MRLSVLLLMISNLILSRSNLCLMMRPYQEFISYDASITCKLSCKRTLGKKSTYTSFEDSLQDFLKHNCYEAQDEHLHAYSKKGTGGIVMKQQITIATSSLLTCLPIKLLIKLNHHDFENSTSNPSSSCMLS